jgi:hypothetical protein
MCDHPCDESLEIREYAGWLGMDPDVDHEILWIAREGLKAPLPKDWKACKTEDTDEIYYFNFKVCQFHITHCGFFPRTP